MSMMAGIWRSTSPRLRSGSMMSSATAASLPERACCTPLCRSAHGWQVFALHGAKTQPAWRAVRLLPSAAGGEGGPHTCAKTLKSVIEATHHALSGFSTAPRGPVLFRMRKKRRHPRGAPERSNLAVCGPTEPRLHTLSAYPGWLSPAIFLLPLSHHWDRYRHLSDRAHIGHRARAGTSPHPAWRDGR